MNKLLSLTTFALLFFACNDEEPPLIITPPDIDHTEIQIDITSMEDELGYTVIKDCYIGTWNASTMLSADGNLLLVGKAFAGSGETRMLLVKTSLNGEIIFFKILHEDEDGSALSVYEDEEQHIYIAGYVQRENNKRFALAKLDQEGSMLWEKTYGPTDSDVIAYHISNLSADEIIVSGSENGNLAFLKINPAGDELSYQIESSTEYLSPNGMLILEDGRILITSGPEEEVYLSWYDQDINLLTRKNYGPRISYGRSSTQLNNGDLVTVGKFTYTTGGTNIIDSQAVLVIKMDVEGEVIWEQRVGNLNFFNDGQSIKENDDGSLVLSGYTLRDSKTDHMLIYLDNEGNELNAKYFTDDKTSRGANIIKVEDGRNMLTGGYQGGTFLLNVDNYGL